MSSHVIKTTYGMTGMPKKECDSCNELAKCARLAPWVRPCEEKQNEMLAEMAKNDPVL